MWWGAGVGTSLSPPPGLTLPRLLQSAERVLSDHEGGEEQLRGVRPRKGSKDLLGGRDLGDGQHPHLERPLPVSSLWGLGK